MTYTQRGRRRGGKSRYKGTDETRFSVAESVTKAMSDDYKRETTYVSVREGRAYRCVPKTPTVLMCGARIFDELLAAPRCKSPEPIADCSLDPDARSCSRCLAEILAWPVAGIVAMTPLSPIEFHTETPRDAGSAWSKENEVRSRVRQLEKLQQGKLKPRKPAAINRNWAKTGESDRPWWAGNLEGVG